MLSETQAKDLKRKHSASMLKIPGVVGVGVEKDPEGGFEVVVHLSEDDPKLRSTLPRNLDGHHYRVEVSGPFKPM